MKKLIKIATALLMTISLGACSQQASPEPITFYITRHGETEYNVQELAQGWCDSPLTENGKEQAKALAKGLKDVEFAAAYSSSSPRAVDTAHLILEGRNLEVETSDNLREMNFGELEEGPGINLWMRDGEFDMDYYFTFGWVDFGGETWGQLGERMLGTLNEIVADETLAGKNVLISTHGMSILALLYGIDLEAAMELGEIDNCSITTVIYENGEFRLGESVNDTSFIE